MLVSSNAGMAGSHDYLQVALSVWIAISASYTALDFAGRVTAARNWSRSAWLAGGTVAMGIGIWSMHLPAMLAFHLTVPLGYRWPTVLLSLLTGILSSAFALSVVSRREMRPVMLWTASILMGGGIAALHHNRTANLSPNEALMAAASFLPSVVPPNLSHSVSISSVGTLGIDAVALMLLALAVFMCLVNRQLAAQAAELEQRVTERTGQFTPVNEEVTESEERFRKLVEALPDSILVHSDNKIVFLNPSCLRLLGAQWPEQFLGKDVFEIIHPDYRQAIKSRIQNNYQTGTASSPMESALLTIGGSAIPIEAAAIPITWKGRPAIEVIARDIRQRKQTEETLREYEKVVEGLEEMICVVDREYRYALANRAFLNYRGREKDQVVGYLVSELLTPSVFDRVVKEKLDECFRGKIVNYELRYDYPDLGPRDLFISYYPIEGPEGIDRAACILRDVTERNQAQRAAREWQKRLELAEKAGLRIGGTTSLSLKSSMRLSRCLRRESSRISSCR